MVTSGRASERKVKPSTSSSSAEAKHIHTQIQTQQRKPINHHFYTRRTPRQRGETSQLCSFYLFRLGINWLFFPNLYFLLFFLRWTTISMTQAFASMSFRVFPPLCGVSPSFKRSRTIWRVTSSAVDQTSSRYYCHFRSCSCCCPPFCLTVVCVTDDSGDLTSCCWIISLSLSLLLSIALIVVWSFCVAQRIWKEVFFSVLLRSSFRLPPPLFSAAALLYNIISFFRLCVNELALNKKKTTPPSTIVYIFYILCVNFFIWFLRFFLLFFFWSTCTICRNKISSSSSPESVQKEKTHRENKKVWNAEKKNYI